MRPADEWPNPPSPEDDPIPYTLTGRRRKDPDYEAYVRDPKFSKSWHQEGRDSSRALGWALVLVAVISALAVVGAVAIAYSLLGHKPWSW